MNRLSREQRCQVVRALVEGNSIRSTVRMTGVAKGTILKLLADLGPVCSAWEDDHNVGLNTKRVECDEIWAFVYAKAKNVPLGMEGLVGDAWTWTAIDAESKLVINWTVGNRDAVTALEFMDGVAKRLKNRVQLSTDGHHSYLTAVPLAFENQIDFAQIVKKYGNASNSTKPETRYSPAVCTGATKVSRIGNPKADYVSTSYVERQNLTMRMGMRRFTRLTNAFSKKAENLAFAVALHFLYYNWARPHQTLKGITPAMAAGLSDHVWSIEEIVGLLEESEASKIHEESN